VDTREQAIHAVDECGQCAWFKVGLQLFSRTGPTLLKYFVGREKRVFLDLKLHDIPNTVAKAAKAAADLGAALTTVHACGGRRMIEAARHAVEGSETKILAVTVLTSISDTVLREEIGLPESAAEAVVRYARLAVDSGAHGIVASPLEIALVRQALGPGPLIVTPGIRPVWAGGDDQARTMTPGEAARAGADFIVVGRPILADEQPALAVQRILEELEA
jgi:orotidine-5'-phosphate decarboxylase